MRRCPSCNSTHWWSLSTGQKECVSCGLRRYFKPKRVLDLVRISSYWKWRLVEYFALGVPAYRLRFQVPYSLQTIRRFFSIIRLAIYKQTVKELQELSGVIEMDEAVFGGRRAGKRGWGAEGKHMVFGIYQRNGRVITFPVRSRATRELAPLISNHTKPGSLYYTDDWHAYTFLAIRGNHIVVPKEKGTPRGRNHLNGIEGFWSYAKHWLYPYRGVPAVKFHLYLKEIEWRFNHRSENIVPFLRKILNQRIVKEQIY